jgi:S1-C subfamily serine protease
MKKKYLVISLIFSLAFTSMTYAEETKLKFRGSSQKTSKEKITIQITQEMLAVNSFKKINKDYKTLTSYAKVMDSMAKVVEKINIYGNLKTIKFRGGAASNIYKQYANSVVYIYNPKAEMIGSGSLFNKSGLIITNWHVVDKADIVGIWTKPKKGEKLEDQDPLGAAVLVVNVEADLAIIKASGLPKNMKVVRLGSQNDIDIGENVFAIGHPQGLPWSLSLGIVSQIRSDHEWTYVDKSEHEADVIQNTTAISPGNSGGPLFNEAGKVVGINTSKAGGENLNFAVAVDELIELLKKNPNLSKANPASKQMKKDYPNAQTGDHNKNGVTDTWYVDTNNNGRIDTAFLDDDEDGFIEGILLDENENEIWEILITDEDLDGKPDHAYIDENEDKTPDVIAYDYDQDGKWDKYKKIS